MYGSVIVYQLLQDLTEVLLSTFTIYCKRLNTREVGSRRLKLIHIEINSIFQNGCGSVEVLKIK